MTIERDHVNRIARLARLDWAPDEIDRLRGDLTAILEWIGVLDELDLQPVQDDGAHPASEPRPDRPLGSLEQDQAVRNAPDARDGAFSVPRVIDR